MYILCNGNDNLSSKNNKYIWTQLCCSFTPMNSTCIQIKNLREISNGIKKIGGGGGTKLKTMKMWASIAKNLTKGIKMDKYIGENLKKKLISFRITTGAKPCSLWIEWPFITADTNASDKVTADFAYNPSLSDLS